ncbi:MAG: tRNA preQ1(34) S-adenosylmethionine ribosyltransferase-isomerase QueA [Firmicutes bacterium]|nr:tRNA preQ1(34) S-adenosylmethionine ribosyltransferase-isomerase QueA [Bacillota bacterium]
MFNYDLPQEYIAQTPVEPRDHSRLMVYDRGDKSTRHLHFYDLIDYLAPGDALVINQTRVLPARLFGTNAKSGGAIEVLLLTRHDIDTWEVLVRPGKKARIGTRISFGPELTATVTGILDDGQRMVHFEYDGVFEEILDRLGQTPLPPYITQRLEDRERYQTVYARENGSAAAPTAGLHFTPELLQRIKDKGVKVIPVLLHVGLGTFRPVKVEDVTKHKMHSEFYSISPEAANEINAVKAAGGRIFAVGTTTTRVLETASDDGGMLHSGSGWTDIFIYPGYRFKCIDSLITNFHLPQSTLIMLVSALCSREEILGLYETAKQMNYRFFSFGDAMLIL